MDFGNENQALLCSYSIFKCNIVFRLFQICVRCPFDYGVLDGLLLLLCEMLAQVINVQIFLSQR